ncbi:glycosyltransferase family 4 protein [Salinimicrobium sp. TH3]|uniref:glycosyltransferase family 4 protein n=1 Tax=Salinimicrobium sp. TH3 TaxID=2997342 RepID=UPI0022732E59|nr:glycosyltransferase family 4 protein [Salinimicrobium sp. TH3]MCY2687950.1 glycosyltransferase family 4 protein [Salinimicrobium sp. TH3]
MKILLLSHNFFPFLGGIETISESLARSFMEQGSEVRIATWTLDPTERAFPFCVFRNPGISLLLKLHFWADVVFENNPSLRLSWPVLFTRRPTVVAIHTWIVNPNGKKGVPEKLKFLWLRRATKVITASNALRHEIWPKATVVENSYSQELFRIIPEIPRSSDFVFLGRLVSDKGVDIAINAIYRLRELNNSENKISIESKLTIIGDGEERKKLENLVDHLGLQKDVKFAGVLRGKELVEELNKHRYMLIPSVWEEPFGIVALEGMACGCLPIVSGGGGLSEAIGHAGLVFRKGDLDDLVDCILHLASNSKLEERCRNEAGPHLASHQSQFVGQRYLDIIRKAV